MTNTKFSIGEQIKACRRKRGLTQSELAQMLGLTKETIHRYERGTQEPSISRVIEMAKCLDTTVDCLLGMKEDEHVLYLDSTSLSLSDKQFEALQNFLLTLRQDAEHIYPTLFM